MVDDIVEERRRQREIPSVLNLGEGLAPGRNGDAQELDREVVGKSLRDQRLEQRDTVPRTAPTDDVVNLVRHEPRQPRLETLPKSGNEGSTAMSMAAALGA